VKRKINRVKTKKRKTLSFTPMRILTRNSVGVLWVIATKRREAGTE
jgi:hypothetical protein